MSNTCHLFGPLYSCSGAVDIDGDSGSNPAMGRSPCSVVRPITPKRVSGGPKRRVLMTKTKTEKTKMNNTKKEAIATIDEILDLIENSDDSLRFSPDYIYNILSRIKKELK
tara:strand:- start:90 stop:422 length:333 start_codon:yes stop_codon:yes gene_type:complete